MSERKSAGTVVLTVLISAITSAVTTVVGGAFGVSEDPVVGKDVGEQFLTYYYNTVTGDDETELRKIYENNVTENASRSLFDGTTRGSTRGITSGSPA